VIGNSLKGKILVFATFFLGMVTGTLIYNVYDTRLRADAPEERSNRSAQREVGQFHDYLGLSPEQREQWNEIMQENRPEYDRLFEENRKLTAHNQARFEALREETRERVRQLLTAEQRQLYDDFNEKQRQRRQPRQR
jgi:Spy/CpxP family protein refolding chaperone